MKGYDKLESNTNTATRHHGARSKLNLLGSSGTTNGGSFNLSFSSKPFIHHIVRPLLRATTLFLIFHLTCPYSPSPGIRPLLPLTLVLGRTLSRRFGWTNGTVSDVGGKESLIRVEGKRYIEYLSVTLDVTGWTAVCLAGMTRGVGVVLAGLTLVGLTPELKGLLLTFRETIPGPGSPSRTTSPSPSIVLAQIGLALTGMYISYHAHHAHHSSSSFISATGTIAGPTTSDGLEWGVEWKAILGWAGVVGVDHLKRRFLKGSEGGTTGVEEGEGEGGWRGRGSRGPEIFEVLFAIALGYTLLFDGTSPTTLPCFSALIVCTLLLIGLFVIGFPSLLNNMPTRKDVYRELGCVGVGLLGLRGEGWGLVGLMLVGWVLVRDNQEEVQEDEQETQQEREMTVPSLSGWKLMGLGGLAVIGIMGMLHQSPSLGMGFGGDVGMVRGSRWRAEVDYELAISLYDEPVSTVMETIQRVKRTLPRFSTSRTTIYTKKIQRDDRDGLEGLLRVAGVDEVVALDNRGREGETYLQHISRRYANVDAPLARQTFFLQPHLAWDWVAESRLKTLDRNTGFVSLGPYLNASCSADGNEKDSHGMSFGRIPQIYSMFQGDLCPPTGFTITWAGQFVVSRKRILSTPLNTYHNLLGYFDVDKGSDDPKAWIWNEGWWNSQPTDPTHGHWLERSWPAVFKCSRLSLTHDCKDEGGPECECRDNVPGQGLL